MRSRWAFAAAVFLLLSGALAITAASPRNAVLKLARSSNELGFDLYQRLRRKPGNLVISPASVTTALCMAWSGARGETAAQMKKVLHLQGTPDEVMAASGELARALQEPSRPIVFHLANQLFAEKTYKLVPAYVEKTRKAFGAPIERLDFKMASEPARVHINQWVESRTDHRIKDLVPPGGVAPGTSLVLVDARKLDALAAAMKYQLVSLALPKFELSPMASLSLREDLRALGMPLAFDPGKADLTGIAKPLKPEERLVLGDVFHKGFVRVDEKGTEAAGATAVEVPVTGPPQEPLQVRADRPFLFLIRDNASGTILFLGRVSDPGGR
ncbi:MAG TPA: serpin family protein [Thermoanaerobaculia bacterium]|jgi:serine protease inhibitor